MKKEGEIKEKREWDTPELVELGVKKTKTGSGGASSDATNYSPGTATNTS